MKTLYLLRHAKSSWDDMSLRDLDRPLAPRGQKGATAMGEYLATIDPKPDLVYCSPSERTRQTIQLVQEAIGEDLVVLIEDELYGGSYLNVIMGAPDDHDCIMLVGHNPSMEGIAAALAGTGPEDDIAEMHFKYPTAGLAEIEFDVERWSEIDRSAGRLRRFVTPRILREI